MDDVRVDGERSERVAARKMAEICSGKIKVEAVGEKCHGRNARTPPGAHGAEICLVFVRFNEIFWT